MSRISCLFCIHWRLDLYNKTANKSKRMQEQGQVVALGMQDLRQDSCRICDSLSESFNSKVSLRLSSLKLFEAVSLCFARPFGEFPVVREVAELTSYSFVAAAYGVDKHTRLARRALVIF